MRKHVPLLGPYRLHLILQSPFLEMAEARYRVDAVHQNLLDLTRWLPRTCSIPSLSLAIECIGVLIRTVRATSKMILLTFSMVGVRVSPPLFAKSKRKSVSFGKRRFELKSLNSLCRLFGDEKFKIPSGKMSSVRKTSLHNRVCLKALLKKTGKIPAVMYL